MKFKIGDAVFSKKDKKENPVGIVVDRDYDLLLVDYPHRITFQISMDSAGKFVTGYHPEQIWYYEESLVGADKYVYSTDFQDKIKDRLKND